MIIISNTFSIDMVKEDTEVFFHKLDEKELKHAIKDIKGAKGYRSIVGNTDMARVFENILGIEVPTSRTTYEWNGRDQMLVGQYTGPMLPEGATELPEGANITWWTVVLC